MKKKGLLLAVVLAMGGALAVADDSDIFTVNAGVRPNVVILIDTSGSMNDSIAGVPKINTARSTIANLVQTTTGMRFGIFRFNGSATGAKMVSPVGASTATMVSAINALTASGQTPLGRASQDIQNYFRGAYSETPSGCGGDDDDHLDCTPTSYPSPVQFECQKNYYILMTDGMPTGESQDLVKTVATSLFTTDHVSSLEGTQNVVVHTIGFNIAEGTALLTQTASNGGGQFYAASNAAQLQAALAAAVSQVQADSQSFAAPLVPSSTSNAGTQAYIATFVPGAGKPFWRGFLKAYAKDASGLIPVGAQGQPLDSAVAWDAGALLAAKTASSRTIHTELSGSLTPFTTSNGSITTTTLAVGTATEKNNLINFIRGIDAYDEDSDGLTSEERSWKLGDIFHSSPVMVFPPPLRSTDSSYNTFKVANTARTKILLVGANDGMLHAFRVSDGQELWSFIPNNMLVTLKNLIPSAINHTFYVDSSPIVADIKISGTWKTIVVFGTRRGGRKYHALDITDTTSPSFLWSFTDAKMGETWSEPTIGQVKMSDGSTKYVAFVGGGYDTASNNSTGKAVFAIDLSNGTKLWEYYNTGSADAAYMNFSIPASPTAADITGDGFLDRVYIGDVGGQLWKFDVSAPATLSGGLVNNWTGKRLFNANPSGANPPASGAFHAPQAMYGRPTLAYDDSKKLWVFIGTGDRNYPNDSSSNSFYGIIDNATMTNGSTLTISSLVDVTATNSTISQGWYFALPATEKVLAGAEVHKNIVYFGTFKPGSVSDCTSQGTTATLYALQMTNGDAAITWATDAAITGETSSDRFQTIGSGITTTPRIVQGSTSDSVVIGTTEGEIVSETRPRTAGKRLRYWRESY